MSTSTSAAVASQAIPQPRRTVRAASLHREHDDREECDEAEQVAVGDDALDRSAVEEQAAGPVERVRDLLAGVGHPERQHRLSHEGADDHLEEQREGDHPAQRRCEGAEQFGPAEHEGEEERGDRRGPEHGDADGRGARVEGPGDGQRRDHEEDADRAREFRPHPVRLQAHEQHHAADEHHERNGAEAPPAEQVAPELTGEGGEEHERRKGPDDETALDGWHES
ncbi:hypothetical protein KIV56_14280 [Cryobacterium breve]|uniref:Uncharacterized protein n=1 Tax=Cryobacterium breve TaxID=1259258 RepID=A0ABY7ND25_9MICO|nr:hypothetical protein [Cryobacterium breve]WBM79490.1 hypothetical protein KIV56_14280 [Cryobacterium breve]